MHLPLNSRLLWGLLLISAPPVPAQESGVFYPSRYYPNAPSRAGALPVELQPGDRSPHLLFLLPESGGTVRARILSEETGEGIAGLLVEARVGRFGSFARTGPDGSVTIPSVPAGRVALRARPDDVRSATGAHAVRYAPGIADSSDALRLDLADGGAVDFGAFTIPAGARVKAAVLDPDGIPWEGIPVVLRGDDPPLRRVRRSDEAGRVTFGGLEPGGYRLWADTRGTLAVSEAWDGSRDTLSSAPLALERGELVAGIEIAPDRGGRIIGAVRHRDTNAGLPGLEVQVFPASDPAAVTSAITDEIGFYQAIGLPTGLYKVYVPAIRRYFPEAETIGQARSVPVAEPDVANGIDVRGLPIPECTIAPEAAAVIEGLVRADFSLFERARVVVWSEADTSAITIFEDGLYRHDCLVSGSYRAAIFPDGAYRPQYHPKVSDPDSATLISVSTGDTARAVDFAPELGIVIEGSVLTAGERIPIEGVPVIAELKDASLSARTVTTADGGFRLQRLPDGTALPSGSWIVRTDSLAVDRISATPIRSIDLSIELVPAGLRLSFALHGAGVADWRLDRAAGGLFPLRVADARTHPDGPRARAWIDRDPPPGARYRLTAFLPGAGGIDSLATAWVAAPDRPPAPAPAPAELFPQPWNGRDELVLPAAPADGETIALHRIDGARILSIRTGGDRIAPALLGPPPSGIYFLRWRDATGREWIRRLVVER